jgi:hypothetical protein
MYNIIKKIEKEVKVIEDQLNESHIPLPRGTHAVKILYH